MTNHLMAVKSVVQASLLLRWLSYALHGARACVCAHACVYVACVRGGQVVGWISVKLCMTNITLLVQAAPYVKGRERYLLPPARLYERRFRSAKTQKHTR